MSYELYLHRSFDYQLSPAASNIIDGAPISRMVGNLLHDRTAPLLRHLRQEAWCQPASASVRPTTPAAVISSSGATGVSSSSPEDSPLGSRGGSPPRGSDPRRPQVPCPTTHRTQWIWHSFGSAPVFYQHGSFSLRAAIYAAVGLSARTTHDPLGSTLGEPGQSVTLGKVERERLLRIEDVLQLAWEYGRLGWMGVVNVRLLPPAQHTRVPLCEVMMRTPWTEWSIQSDELVLSWCGFLTLLQRRQSRTASSSSSEPPLQRGESNGGGLRQLKIGAGVVVKNDLASGINLYWGLSGQAGRGLAFSGHVDVLRRLCCAVSTSVGPLELATRLRLNLITLHRTGLDVGLIYYPLKELPRTAVRVSSSTSGQTVALHVRDVSREWLSWWLDARELRRQEKLAVVQPATPATAAPVTKKPAAPSPAGVRHHSTKDAAPEASASVPTSLNKIPAEPSSGVWTSVGHIWGSLTHVFTGSPAPRAPPPPRQAHAAVRMLQAGAAVGVRGVEFGRAVAVAAPQYARLVLHRAWSLDWLETALRAAEVDVTVGITNGVGRGARGFGTYCVISTH